MYSKVFFIHTIVLHCTCFDFHCFLYSILVPTVFHCPHCHVMTVSLTWPLNFYDELIMNEQSLTSGKKNNLINRLYACEKCLRLPTYEARGDNVRSTLCQAIYLRSALVHFSRWANNIKNRWEDIRRDDCLYYHLRADTDRVVFSPWLDVTYFSPPLQHTLTVHS